MTGEPTSSHGPVERDRKILMAWPRGSCAGVRRAVEAVELALARYGAPVYVRKQIVHNLYVVRELEARGAVFVDSEQEVPEDSVCIFSAHGVAPVVHERARQRRLTVIDATCPLVTKVHVEARRFAGVGKTIVLIGHAGHEEIEGTSGEAPGQTIVVERPEEVETLTSRGPTAMAYLTQTTLAVDDTAAVIEALRKRFPAISGPRQDDICYASQNRQTAVKALAVRSDVILVVGSANSSNANRLVEVAREAGVPSWLIEDERSIDAGWVRDATVIGVSSAASTPELLVERVVSLLQGLGFHEIEEVPVATEDVHFPPPAGLA